MKKQHFDTLIEVHIYKQYTIELHDHIPELYHLPRDSMPDNFKGYIIYAPGRERIIKTHFGIIAAPGWKSYAIERAKANVEYRIELGLL